MAYSRKTFREKPDVSRSNQSTLILVSWGVIFGSLLPTPVVLGFLLICGLIVLINEVI